MSDDGFTLSGTNADFDARQRNMFLALTEIERKVNSNRHESMETDNQHKRSPKTSKSQTKTFRGKESIFKVPQDPSPKNFLKKIPDFKKNPHKWTKYSLEDVKDEDISDKANTKAALSFLKDLETRNKVTDTELSFDTQAEQKIIFRRPTHSCTMEKDSDNKPSFRSSKIVMPEYVVGQKIKKNKKTKNISTKMNTSLKLDHLYEEDNDEDK